MPNPDLFAHSIALIRTHQAPSGAYIASPTFPTYAYSWFRDGAYIAYAMDLAGEHSSAAQFYDWAVTAVLRRTTPTERVIAATLRGDPIDPVDLLHTRYTLAGDAAAEDWPNFQLDGFGTLLWGLAEHLRQTNQPLPDPWRPAVDLVARYLGALWRAPCYDCWEEFGDKIHTASLAACYGGLTAAATMLGATRDSDTAATIRHYAMTACLDNGCLAKFAGNTAVDANLIHVATPYRLLAPDDPVMRATIARIEAELRRDDGVHRYAGDSYYGGGAWILLTAYLGWHYVDRGEPERALPLLTWIERQTDPLGNLPEQIATNLNHPEMLPVWNERWGLRASPLLWSHAAYITLVAHLRAAGIDLSPRVGATARQSLPLAG